MSDTQEPGLTQREMLLEIRCDVKELKAWQAEVRGVVALAKWACGASLFASVLLFVNFIGAIPK